MEIRRRLRAGEQGKDIASSLSISRSNVSLIRLGKAWAHLAHLDHALLPGPACGAVHITYLDTAKITHYACSEKAAHEPPHRDGEKEWT